MVQNELDLKDGGELVIGPAGENLVPIANIRSGDRYLGRGGLGAVLEVKNGLLREIPELEGIAVEVAREGCIVAQQLGVEFEVHPLELLWDTIERTWENYNSTLQDIMRGKKSEVDYINGKIVEYASSVGLEAPRNELLWVLVKAKEKLNRGSGNT